MIYEIRSGDTRYDPGFSARIPAHSREQISQQFNNSHPLQHHRISLPDADAHGTKGIFAAACL